MSKVKIRNRQSKTLNKLSISDANFGIALSGGGYRATLFHLGVLRRLNEIGWRSRIDRVVTVSGGSLLLGYLLCRVPEALDRTSVITSDDWSRVVSEPVHDFVQNDLRTIQVLQNFTINLLGRRDKRLENSISRLRRIYGDQTLGDFWRTDKGTRWPEIYILATDCTYGQAFRFANRASRSGHSTLGFATLRDFPVADACMISACFPPLFGPYFPNLQTSDFKGARRTIRDERPDRLVLTDGGLYDNLGTNLIMNGPKTFVRLFSDAGNPLTFSSKDSRSLMVTKRYLELMSSFIGRLNFQRVRAIEEMPYAFASAQFVQSQAGQDGFGFGPDLVERYFRKVRTDLDRFTSSEAKILENHGYAQIEFALKNQFGTKYTNLNVPKAKWPYPEPKFCSPEHVKPVLITARNRKIFSQLSRLRLKGVAG